MKTELQSAIERLFALGAQARQDREARPIFTQFRDALTQGKIRAAEKVDGRWQTNVWVKQGILLGFRLGELAEMSGSGALSFVDKFSLPL